MRRRPRRRPRFSLVEANRLRNTISQQQTFDALDVSRGDAIQSRTVCTVLHSITRTFPRVDLLSRVTTSNVPCLVVVRRIKRRRWIDQTARKLVDVTEREARRRHRHGNINVKITFAVGANIDHPCFRGHKGGRLPNRKLIQALARLRRVVLIDEYYTTKRYVYISRCISVLIIQHHSSNQVLLL